MRVQKHFLKMALSETFYSFKFNQCNPVFYLWRDYPSSGWARTVQSQLFWAGLVLNVTSCQADVDNEPQWTPGQLFSSWPQNPTGSEMDLVSQYPLD